MIDPDSRRRPRNLLLLSVLATTLVIVVLMLLAEGGVRLRQWLKHGQTGTVDSLLQRDANSGLRVPRPGVHNGRIHINKQGFRGQEINQVKPPLRVAFIGASTTFCAEASGDEATWPHLVSNGLKSAMPGLHMDYVNAGVPGYVVEDSLDNWRHRVEKLKPDVVVIYHATNDLSLDTRKLASQQGVQSRDAEKTSWLAEHSMLWFLVEKTLQAKTAQQRAVSESPHIEVIPSELPRDFGRRLHELVKAVQSSGALVVLPTFSYRLRHEQGRKEQLKAAESALYYMPYMSLNALLEGYETYNQAIRHTAVETGAILLEGELDIPGDERHFTDSVHFTDEGNAAMAKRVTQGLLQSPEFRARVNHLMRQHDQAGNGVAG